MTPSLPAITSAGEWAFFLDLDGTLFEIASKPDLVRIPFDLAGLMQRVAVRFGGALSILTGRTIDDADRLLAPLKLPMAGVHGAELRTNPGGTIRKVASPLKPELAEAVRKLERLSHHVVIENKGAGLAIHFRRTPEIGPVIEAALKELVETEGKELRVQRGRMVCELLPADLSKEAALQQMLLVPPFRGRWPVMVGDDQTDEASIALATRLGGAGLKVFGEHFRGEECHFADPRHVRSWLHDVLRRVAD